MSFMQFSAVSWGVTGTPTDLAKFQTLENL